MVSGGSTLVRAGDCQQLTFFLHRTAGQTALASFPLRTYPGGSRQIDVRRNSRPLFRLTAKLSVRLAKHFQELRAHAWPVRHHDSDISRRISRVIVA